MHWRNPSRRRFLIREPDYISLIWLVSIKVLIKLSCLGKHVFGLIVCVWLHYRKSWNSSSSSYRDWSCSTSSRCTLSSGTIAASVITSKAEYKWLEVQCTGISTITIAITTPNLQLLANTMGAMWTTASTPTSRFPRAMSLTLLLLRYDQSTAK